MDNGTTLQLTTQICTNDGVWRSSRESRSSGVRRRSRVHDFGDASEDHTYVNWRARYPTPTVTTSSTPSVTGTGPGRAAYNDGSWGGPSSTDDGCVEEEESPGAGFALSLVALTVAAAVGGRSRRVDWCSTTRSRQRRTSRVQSTRSTSALSRAGESMPSRIPGSIRSLSTSGKCWPVHVSLDSVFFPVEHDARGVVGRLGTDAFEGLKRMARSVEDLTHGLFGRRPVGVEEAKLRGVLFDQVIEATTKPTFAHAPRPRDKPQRDERA